MRPVKRRRLRPALNERLKLPAERVRVQRRFRHFTALKRTIALAARRNETIVLPGRGRLGCSGPTLGPLDHARNVVRESRSWVRRGLVAPVPPPSLRPAFPGAPVVNVRSVPRVVSEPLIAT